MTCLAPSLFSLFQELGKLGTAEKTEHGFLCTLSSFFHIHAHLVGKYFKLGLLRAASILFYRLILFNLSDELFDVALSLWG
jgi:hypothetical protein